MSNSNQSNTKFIIPVSIVAALIILPLIFFSTFFISEHEVAVKIDQGEIVGKMTTGPHMEMPFFTDVVRIPTTTQDYQIEGVSSATTDNYTVGNSRIEYMYRIPQKNAIELYRKYPNYHALIRNEVENATKDVIGQYELIEIPENREAIGDDIVAMVRERLTNDMGVDFKNAALTYYEWGQQGKNAIRNIQAAQRKQETEREKLQAQKVKNERLSVKQEAADKRKAAKQKAKLKRDEREQESNSKQRISKAESKAEAKLIQAEAEAEALEKIAKVIENNPMLLRRQAIKEWDGKLPIIGESGMSSRIDIKMKELMKQRQ